MVSNHTGRGCCIIPPAVVAAAAIVAVVAAGRTLESIAVVDISINSTAAELVLILALILLLSILVDSCAYISLTV